MPRSLKKITNMNNHDHVPSSEASNPIVNSPLKSNLDEGQGMNFKINNEYVQGIFFF